MLFLWAHTLLLRVIGGVLFAAALLSWRDAEFGASATFLLAGKVPTAGLALLEATFGGLLLIGLAPRIVQVGAAGCFLCFAVFSGARAFAGHADCGCFGRIEIRPEYTLTFDLMAAAACAWQGRQRKELLVRGRALGQRIGVAGVVVVSLVCAVGVFAWSPSVAVLSDRAPLGESKVIFLKPSEWLARPCPLLDFISNADRLRCGRWIVFLYDQNCEYCRKALQDRTTFTAGRADLVQYQIAAVAIPPVDPARFPSDGDSNGVAWFRLSESHLWLAEMPTVFALDDSIVEELLSGTAQ